MGGSYQHTRNTHTTTHTYRHTNTFPSEHKLLSSNVKMVRVMLNSYENAHKHKNMNMSTQAAISINIMCSDLSPLKPPVKFRTTRTKEHQRAVFVLCAWCKTIHLQTLLLSYAIDKMLVVNVPANVRKRQLRTRWDGGCAGEVHNTDTLWFYDKRECWVWMSWFNSSISDLCQISFFADVCLVGPCSDSLISCKNNIDFGCYKQDCILISES